MNNDDTTYTYNDFLDDVNEITENVNIITDNIVDIVDKFYDKINELEAENKRLREMLKIGKQFKKIKIVKPLFRFDKHGGKVTYRTIVNYVKV